MDVFGTDYLRDRFELAIRDALGRAIDAPDAPTPIFATAAVYTLTFRDAGPAAGVDLHTLECRVDISAAMRRRGRMH